MNINQTENPLRFANSFHASRLKTGPITVYGSSCYLWKFKLNKQSMIPFLTIDFATQLQMRDNSDGSIDQINSTLLRSDILTVDPYVSPYRICRSLQNLDFINADPYSNATFLLRGHYFRCDSISENDYNIETKKMSEEIVVQTRTNYPRDVNLIAIFLATHKMDPKTGKPDCGKPETIRTGANFRESNLGSKKSNEFIISNKLNYNFFVGISQFQYQCNDSFIDITHNKMNNSRNYWYSVNCSINGLWKGQFPLCIPRAQCPGIDYLETNKDPSVIIESIENVYYVNESYWLAGEHSRVNFACIDQEHIVIGKLSRECLKSGSWSPNMPKCTAYVKPGLNISFICMKKMQLLIYLFVIIESLKSQSPWTIITILTILLLLFLTFVFLIVRKYVSNMRKELINFRNNKSRKNTSIYADIKSNISVNHTGIYDDCDNTRLSTRNLSNKLNKIAKKNLCKYKYEAEYIELEGMPTSSKSEPLYIPILPPIP